MPADANSTFVTTAPGTSVAPIGRAGATAATPPMAVTGSSAGSRIVLVTMPPVALVAIDRTGQTSFFATGATVPRPRGTIGLLYPLQG